MMATMADAHREWHLNSGVPMGQPGCPQDACHPHDDPSEGWPTEGGPVKCGNKNGPWGDFGHHHQTSADVRECYAMAGRFVQQVQQHVAAAAPAVVPQPVVEAPVKSLAARWGSIPVGDRGFGYYALEDAQGTVHFYRVERPTEGKWAGKTFVKEQASDAYYPIEPRPRAYTILTLIASDPQEAGMRYATELRKCTRCNRTLTDLESRARGMGPDCAGKGGW